VTGLAWKIPSQTGRTMEYLVMRACERFGVPPSHFRQLANAEQVRWLGYEELREAEEAGEVDE